MGIEPLQGSDSDADDQSDGDSDDGEDAAEKVDSRQIKHEIREAARLKRKKQQRLAEDDEQDLEDAQEIFDSSLVEEEQKKRKCAFDSDGEDDAPDIYVVDQLAERAAPKLAPKQSARTYGHKGVTAFVAPDSQPEESVSTSAK